MDWLAKVDPNYVTVATWAIGLVAAFVLARYTLIPHYAAKRRERVLDTRTWNDMIAALQPDWAHRYYGAIAASTGWFDRTYGSRLLGWRAFDRALQFAFVYASVTLLIGWVLFDVGSIGNTPFFSEEIPAWRRTLVLLFLVLSAAFFLLFGKFDPRSYFRSNEGHRNLTSRSCSFRAISHLKIFKSAENPEHALTTISVLAGLPIGIGAYFVGFVALDTGFAIAAIVALFGLLALGSGSAQMLFSLFAIGLVSVLAVVSGSEDNGAGVLLRSNLLLFLIILPILNAISDYLSVAATRQFLRRIHRRKSAAWGVLVGLALDIVIAMACLALLLMLMTQTLDLWAAYSPIPLTFDWRIYRDTLCAGNWQQGTMLWLMLATTLAPTVLHLCVGVSAMVSYRAQVDAQIAAIITPAYEKLQAGRAVEKGDGALARKLLTAGDIQTLEDLLARKEGLARVIAVILFAAFMAALIWMVAVLAQHFALPTLCPAP